MDDKGDDGRTEPLLGTKRPKPLLPLYTVTLIQALAFTVAKMPALSLRFQEFAAQEGWEAPAIAAALGKMAALRNLLEFFATPVLATWSDRVGRRKVMCISCVALCVECALLASARSIWTLFLSHTLFGLFNDSNGTLESSCIADATPPGSARVIALGKLYSVVGAAIVVGPALGGELAAIGGMAPLIVGCFLACASLAYMLFALPEYLPAGERAQQSGTSQVGGSSSLLRDFAGLMARSPGLRWYVAASTLAQMALGAYASVQALWAREALGWDGRDLGRFLSVSGLTMMAAQSLLLPMLLKAMHGREPALAQLCLLVQAARLAAYGFAPRGAWVYAASMATTAGLCHNPVLRSLCSRSAGKAQQGLLAGGTSAVGTAAQVLGSLLGSGVFAASLRCGLPLNIPLLLSASLFLLAAASVAQGKRADARQKAGAASAKLPEAVAIGA